MCIHTYTHLGAVKVVAVVDEGERAEPRVLELVLGVPEEELLVVALRDAADT
jgi:hypothetical protein